MSKPQCQIQYEDCLKTRPKPNPAVDWYGCRPCGQSYTDPRIRSTGADRSQFQSEKSQLARWLTHQLNQPNFIHKISVSQLHNFNSIFELPTQGLNKAQLCSQLWSKVSIYS